MLNGDEAIREKVVAALQKSGFVCSRVGRSRRPASNGLQYDWFIRVFDPSTRQKPDKAKIEDILYKLFGVEPVEQQIEKYQRKIEENQKYLQALQQRVLALQQEIEQERASQEAVLNEAIEKEERAKQLEQENAHLKAQIQNLEEIIKAQIEQRKTLERQIAVLREALASQVEGKGRQGAARLLNDLFPKMRFIKGSKDYLLVEAPDSRSLLRLLDRLYNHNELKTERFESAEPKIWFKVVYKGYSRIYFTRHNGSLHVFISPKKQQRNVKSVLEEYAKSELT